MDATLEVAVAREDRGHDEVIGLDGLSDRTVERTAVADAGGAAVAHDVEAELLEWRQKPGLCEVLGDRAGDPARGWS